MSITWNINENNKTQQGIFCIFNINDMVLICSKEQKYKWLHSLVTNDSDTIINIDQIKSIIIFQNGINDKKKVTVLCTNPVLILLIANSQCVFSIWEM